MGIGRAVFLLLAILLASCQPRQMPAANGNGTYVFFHGQVASVQSVIVDDRTVCVVVISSVGGAVAVDCDWRIRQ